MKRQTKISFRKKFTLAPADTDTDESLILASQIN